MPTTIEFFFCHGELLVFGALHKKRLFVEREHGRTIPLTDIGACGGRTGLSAELPVRPED